MQFLITNLFYYFFYQNDLPEISYGKIPSPENGLRKFLDTPKFIKNIFPGNISPEKCSHLKMFYTSSSRDLDRVKGMGRLIQIQGASGPQENEEVLHPNIFQQTLIFGHFHLILIFWKI